MNKHTPLLLGLLTAYALLVTACGAKPSVSLPAAAPPQAIKPAAITHGTPPPPAPAANADTVASAHPTNPLPTPGQMPAGSYMKSIQDRGYLYIGSYRDVYLLSYLNPLTNTYEGFDIDFAHAIAQALTGDASKVKVNVIRSDERIPSVLSGDARTRYLDWYFTDPNGGAFSEAADAKTADRARMEKLPTVDVVIASMTINDSRRAWIDFSEEYFEAGQKVLVPTNSPYKGIQDLVGQPVCSTIGSTSIDNLKPYNTRVIAVADFSDCLVALEQGTAQAATTDDTILAGLAAQARSTHVVGDRFTTEPYGIAVSPTHRADFLPFINGVVEQVKASGAWAKYYDQWFTPLKASPTDAAPQPPTPIYKNY